MPATGISLNSPLRMTPLHHTQSDGTSRHRHLSDEGSNCDGAEKDLNPTVKPALFKMEVQISV